MLFDYGGVLSTGGRPGTLANIVSEHFGVPLEDLDLARQHDQLRRGTLCSDDFFEEMNERFRTTQERLTAEIYVARADYLQTRAESVYQLASALRGRGITTAILSNVYRMSARELTKIGRYDDFEPVILSCYEGMAKEVDVDFYRLAMERSGVPDEQILFIDDQEKNLVPARNLGMIALRSDSPKQVVADVAELFRRENGIELSIAA